MGILDGMGATKSWFHSTTLTKSFALIKKRLNSAEIFYLDAKRNAQRWQWNTNVRHTKINADEWKDVMPRHCWYLVVQLSCSLRIFFDSSLTAFDICLFLCSSMRNLTLLVPSSSFKVEEFLHKTAIFLENSRVDQTDHSSLARWHDWPYFGGDHWLRLLDILSVDLDTSVSLPQSKTQLQKTFSPNAGAFSLWHSPPQ